MTVSPHQPTPNIRLEWSRGLREWAEANDAVCQLWIFGSRARGDALEGSDIDIALALAPPVKGRGDPALGAYFHLESEWKQQLQSIVGIDVSPSLSGS
jgi:predicted nucleotidyltransferase